MSVRRRGLPIFRLTPTLLLLFLCAPDAAAQTHRPLLSASLGIIRNAQSESSQTQYAIYPEIQLTGNAVGAASGLVALDWSIYAGGWDEDLLVPAIHESCPSGHSIGNCSRSVHSSVLAGVRLHVVLTKSAGYFSFFSGYSRQYVWTDWEITPFDAASAGTALLKLNAVEAGMRVQFSVTLGLLVGGAFQVYFFGKDAGFDVRRRPAYSLVISRRIR